MKSGLIFLLLTQQLVVPAVRGQQTPAADIDPAFIDYAADGIDYPGCMSDLITADRNGDGVIKKNEYLDFIQTYGKRICHTTDRLSLKQHAAFNTLACRCQGIEGTADDCCVGPKAEIITAGALNAGRTQEELFNLVAICRVTDGTIEQPRGCPPNLRDPDEPPPFTVIAPPPQAEAAGLSPGEIAGIVIGALAFLLLLLCCCCVVRKRQRRAAEEEEEERIAAKTAAQEQAPPAETVTEEEYDTIPPILGAAAVGRGPDEEDMRGGAGRGNIPNDEWEEDVEMAAGSGMVDGDSDEEDMIKGRGSADIPPGGDDNRRRLRAAGLLPPEDNDDERIKLRPPPDKDPEEDPDWDQPGRLMNEPKDKVDDEGQVFDPYNPDGGVYDPQRPGKEPLDWRSKWQRPEVEDPDEHDNRKHRIQSGLGEGEVWNKLAEHDDDDSKGAGADGGGVFDWVVQSALGVLSKSDEEGHLENKS